MEKRMNQTLTIHGILFTALLILPIVWGATAEKEKPKFLPGDHGSEKIPSEVRADKKKPKFLPGDHGSEKIPSEVGVDKKKPKFLPGDHGSEKRPSEEQMRAGLPAVVSNPAHEIPFEGAKVNPWFANIIKASKERKDIEPDLKAAEAKAMVINVALDGKAKFKSIQRAVESVEIKESKGNNSRVIINIGPGVYTEKVRIDRYRPYITLSGDKASPPTLVFGASSPRYEAMDTATLTVEGDYFQAVNLNIANDAQLKGNGSGAALRVTGNYASFYTCKITGKKNTLLDDQGKHFFKDCLIEGSEDFILGDGRSIYLSSEIRVLPHKPTSIITAQARKNVDPRLGGFVFAHCRVTGEKDVKALLGRTYMAASRVIFAHSFLSAIVEPKGWYDAFDTDYEKTSLLGEYKNTGPGADMSKRIKVPCTKPLTDKDVKPYLTLDFIDAGEWLLPPGATPGASAAAAGAEPGKKTHKEHGGKGRGHHN